MNETKTASAHRANCLCPACRGDRALCCLYCGTSLPSDYFARPSAERPCPRTIGAQHFPTRAVAAPDAR
jgi:hypothetical protein